MIFLLQLKYLFIRYSILAQTARFAKRFSLSCPIFFLIAHIDFDKRQKNGGLDFRPPHNCNAIS